jgi:integrase
MSGRVRKLRDGTEVAVHNNGGIRKLCDCRRSTWPKCSHPWHMNFKFGARHYRLSIDREVGRRIDSKTEAENEATRIRTAILDGTFLKRADRMRTAEPGYTKTSVSAVLTLDSFADKYVDRVRGSGKASWKDDKALLQNIRNYVASDGRRLGEWPVTTVTEDELENFHSHLVVAGRAASTRNHHVQVLKAAFRWAAKKGFIPASPITSDSALKRTKHSQRSRRVAPDEATALIAAAASLSRKSSGLRLSGLIIAALETGCRRGELLSLQWGDVDLGRRELVIRAGNAKDREVRRLPISTRLAAVLEMGKTDAEGREYSAAAYVFGASGVRVKGIKKAWETCILKAHGHEPKWEKKSQRLSAESRSILRAIDLHFHDLRHEAGSRWLEAGMPLHHVKEMLGHANISQTDTYLNAGRMALHDSIKRFDAGRCNPVANESASEHRSSGNATDQQNQKDLLH